jgi:type II secretory pathway pseudopilin PulG
MMNKKGSLNLSIQMIVIVVIAFVVLGLGLGFVRTQFTSVSDTSEQVQKQIEQQVLDDLRRGNQKLSFPTDELVLETGEDTVQSIGVKNTKDGSLTLRMAFYVKNNVGFEKFTSEVNFPFTTVSDVSTNSKIIWNSDPQEFPPGESRVIPVTITAPDKIGTYLYKIVIEDQDGGVFDERTFFIKTT